MRVALVHHHLRAGGVTRVIRDQVDSLRSEGAGGARLSDAMVITGELPHEPLPCPTARVAALAYDRDRAEPVQAEAAAREIVEATRRMWPQGADLYHFHNPTLGKNRSLVGVIRSLQRMAQVVLLQIHDFAEDGRPELYTEEPYPEDCHYVAINRRDVSLLRLAGLRDEGLHYLPNPVRPLSDRAGPSGLGSSASEGRLFLYPVRAIRRKNVGEALLLSLFLPEGCELGVTLEPSGPLDRRCRDDWKKFVVERGLPVRFGLGVGRSLESLLAGCRGVITTSIKEGFGFAFLEPWTAGVALYGRFLKETCPDFAEAGVRLDHLYDRVRVPLSWIDPASLGRKLRECLQSRRTAYRMEGPDESVRLPALPADSVDFGDLSEDLQRQVLIEVLENPRSRTFLEEGNPLLAGPLRAGLPRELIESNGRAVLEQFSLEATGARLQAVYNSARERPVRHALDKSVLVHELNAEAGSLLLCPGSYGVPPGPTGRAA